MGRSDEQISVDGFLRRLGRAQGRVLLLDYDGTLAPFRPERDRAFPYPEVVDPINRLSTDTDTRLVLISGRGIADLLPLVASFDPLPEMWGSHGWERRNRNGNVHAVALPDAVAAALKRARTELAEAGFDRHGEVKPAGVAVHWRGLDPSGQRRVEQAARERWGHIVDASGGQVALHEFDGGLELRPAGRNKGDAVREILSEVGEHAAIAYAGDDRTDEDAFRALGSRGLCVLVRAEPRPTMAHVRLRPPDGLVEFLTRWRLACTNE